MNRIPKLLLILVVLILAAAPAACRRDRGGEKSSSPVLPKAPERPAAAVTSYADVVARVSDAVVTVRSESTVRAPRRHPFSNDPLFREFFGDLFGGSPQPRLERGLGSGVIVTEDGYILTNHHVVDGADKIRVEMSENRSYKAKIVGSDPPTDLAVLKIDAGKLPVLRLGNSDQVRVGDVVLAIGNPFGVGKTVTAGIISAKERSTGMGAGTFESFLQTDAPINRGNSGGALVNSAGDLIGINSQIVSTSGAGGNVGIGFAVPSNMARQVAEQLIKSGNVRRGKLGVQIRSVNQDFAASLGLESAKGAIIEAVESGSPAQRAGIRQYDVITQLNGDDVEDSNQLRNRIAAIPPGTEVTLTILRDGQRQQVRVKLSELSEESGRSSAQGDGSGEGHARLGIRVAPLTPDLAAQIGAPRNAQGVVIVDVDPVGPAGQAGLRQGDLIQQVNRQAIRSVEDLQNALQRSGNRPALLLIRREGTQYLVTVQP